jgi:hypothetical protein
MRTARPSATPALSAKTGQEKLTGRQRVYATWADNANASTAQNIPGVTVGGGCGRCRAASRRSASARTG